MVKDAAQVLTEHGLVNAAVIVRAAQTAGLDLAVAAALIEKESGGHNIYGHDKGGVFSVPGQSIPVTAVNFAEFLQRVLAGERSNGVGPAQITYPGYFRQDPTYPWWDPYFSCLFGFKILASYLRAEPLAAAGSRYNSGSPTGAPAYGADLVVKTARWRDRLAAVAPTQPEEAPVSSYNFITRFDSPNHGGFGRQITLPARRAVLHWWGNPSGQNPQGIIDWLCNPVSEVSAHAVVWPGNVACLVNYDEPSWANGNTDANTTSITLECDPNDIDGTIPTVVEYLADLVRQENLHPDFVLSGHKDWYNTACPGVYYPRLAEIRQRVRDTLAGATTPPPATGGNTVTQEQAARIIALLEQISSQTLTVADAVTAGREGVKFDGDLYAQAALAASRLAGVTHITSEAQPIDPAKLAAVTDAVSAMQASVTTMSEALAGLAGK